jgi:carbonic anhydrase
MPNFESVVNPWERRGPTLFNGCYKNSVRYEHQKLRVIGQVVDERLAVWSAIDPSVTKNFFGIATSNVEETIITECHSCGAIKASGLWLDKDARGALPKIMSHNRILPAASNEKITTVWTEQQMDRPIELIALLSKVSQIATRASLVDSYAIGSAIRDKHLVIWRKNHCSDFQ